ncbi:MAG: hypothetical protein R6W91_00215 [Thermoplasmata archaeon]
MSTESDDDSREFIPLEYFDETKIEKCVSWLRELIGDPISYLDVCETISYHSEYVVITARFALQGAWVCETSPDRHLNIHLVLEFLHPKKIDPDMNFIKELAIQKIRSEFKFLGEIPWDISIDNASFNNIRWLYRKEEFSRNVMRSVMRGNLSKLEAADVLTELLVTLRPELGDVLAPEDVGNEGKLINIQSRGLKCPICMGHLSEDMIHAMYHWLRYLRWGERGKDEEF